MKNPFEKFPSRRQEYNETEEKKESIENKIDKLKAPLGHLRTDDFFANLCHETLNAIISLPSTPEIKLLEMRVRMAQNKLERIYRKDEADARKLNERYSAIIKKVIETGDDTERKQFEKDMLGMGDNESEKE